MNLENIVNLEDLKGSLFYADFGGGSLNPNIYKIKIDTILELKNEHFTVSAGDINSHELEIEVTQNNEPYPLTDLTVEIDFLKSDGKLNRQNTDKGITITEPLLGKVDCILETNSINKQGRIRAEVRISKGIDLLTTKRFEFYVNAPLATDNIIESTTEFPILTELIIQVNGVLAEYDVITQAEAVRLDAEGVRSSNEIARETLRGELLTLKLALEGLQTTLSSLEVTVSDNEDLRVTDEGVRKDNEVLRIQLYNDLLTLQTQLNTLKTETTTAKADTIVATTNANNAANAANSTNDVIVTAEGLRVTAEGLRVTADNLRTTAEQARVTSFNNALSTFNTNSQTAIDDLIAETNLVESQYPVRLTAVENDLVAHKEDYATQTDMKLTNKFINGNFFQGLTGYTSSYGDLVTDALGAKYTMLLDTWAANIRLVNSVGITTNNKYYISCDVFSDVVADFVVTSGRIEYSFAVGFAFIGKTVANSSIKLSGVTGTLLDDSVLRLALGLRRTTGFGVNNYYIVNNLLLIDLTTTFGANNEPTKEEMDTLIDILGGWFDGEITLTQKQLANWYLKMIRQNRTAIVALGGTIV